MVRVTLGMVMRLHALFVCSQAIASQRDTSAVHRLWTGHLKGRSPYERSWPLSDLGICRSCTLQTIREHRVKEHHSCLLKIDDVGQLHLLVGAA